MCANTANKPAFKWSWLNFGVSTALSALLLYAVFSETSLPELLKTLSQVNRKYLGAFMACSLIGLFLRALRYRLILAAMQAESAPSYIKLVLITGVRNACVDLLPARLGEISYLYLLKRFGVGLPRSIASFGLCLALDILALVLLAGIFAIGTFYAAEQSVLVPKLWAALGLLAACFGLGLYVLRRLDSLLALFSKVLSRFYKHEKSLEVLSSMAADIGRTAGRRKLGGLLLVTLLLRAAKYSGLYLLTLSVLFPWQVGPQELTPLEAFSILVLSEASASLPMSGILGFGLYEGVWSTLFSMACGSACLNVPATSVAFSIHLVSQLVGYSVAILSLCAIFMLLAKFNPGKLWRCALLIICWTSYPALAEDRSPLFSVLSPAALTGKIAFSATWKGKSRVYLLDLRAATVTPLSPDGIEASYPSFSPDGKYLALSIGPQDKRQIAVMASDGSGLRLLTTGPGASDHPAWSPDGKTIAFFSESPGNPKIANLFRLDPSQPGSALQITHYRGRNTTPQWSNDSTVLAFSTSRFWPGWDICLYNINLKEESCPLRGLRTYCRPRFSHYGDKLAYSTGAFDDVDIFIRDLKTARDTRLSALTGRDYDATWSPDDRFIAFTNSSGHEHFNLFVQALDSAQAHTLIKSEASIRYLSWVK